MEKKSEQIKESKSNNNETSNKANHQGFIDQRLSIDSVAKPLLTGTSEEVDFAMELFEGTRLRREESNVPKNGRRM